MGCSEIRMEHCQKTLIPGFRDLFTESHESLTDIVLYCCEDGVRVRSFKVLLAACSTVFKTALQASEAVDAVILPEVHSAEITNFHRCLFEQNFESDDSGVDLDPFIEIAVLFGIPLTPYFDSEAGYEASVGRGERETQETELSDAETALKKSKIPCPECDKEYSNFLSYEKHVQSHLKNNNNNKENETNDGRRRTRRRVTKPKRFEDDIKTDDDDEEEEEEEEDEEGENKDAPDEVFPCTECGEIYLNPDHLLKHFKKHQTKVGGKSNNEKKFACEVCSRSFSSNQALRNHSALHSEERPFECESCGKKFVTAATLESHKKLHDPESQVRRPFPCEHCSRSFNNSSNLMRHVRSFHFEYSDKKKFLCSECGKHFKDPSALTAHRKIHTGVRPYECSSCKKTFLTGAQLRVHKRIHSGERPFVCNQCGRTFTTNGQLKSHKIHRHIGVQLSKKHLCSECGVSFVKAYDLKVHLLRHTGEKPYPCLECGRGFRSDRHLKDHKRVHTGEKPYRCETCGKSFSAPAGLRQHFKVHDNCRINASEGAYSIKTNKHLKYGRVPLQGLETIDQQHKEDLEEELRNEEQQEEQQEYQVVLIGQEDFTLVETSDVIGFTEGDMVEASVDTGAEASSVTEDEGGGNDLSVEVNDIGDNNTQTIILQLSPSVQVQEEQ